VNECTRTAVKRTKRQVPGLPRSHVLPVILTDLDLQHRVPRNLTRSHVSPGDAVGATPVDDAPRGAPSQAAVRSRQINELGRLPR
jgi:hypothetical protein